MVASGRAALDVYLTVDVEPDCPPYLWTWRGIEEGMPKLLSLLAEEQVAATCFVTGDTAEKFPHVLKVIAGQGHEIGSHGFSHHSFADFDDRAARSEIARTRDVLRSFADVVSFRAPYLRLPERFVPMLAEFGMLVDSSRARYKVHERRNTSVPHLRRLSASTTSSVLRLPGIVRDSILKVLKSPVVLFVHPWEFVDLTRSTIRFDCRFRTGDRALDDLRHVIRLYQAAGARFMRVADYRG
jgi:peptidoglycan/xylan/chitin deacetylase (PgdA/CDA1 family)